DVNNKKVASALAVLDQDDGKRRDERNELLRRFRDRLDQDEEFQRLKGERDKATGQQRARLERELMQRGEKISREEGYHGHVEAAPTKREKKAGKLIEHETIKNKVESNLNDLTHGDKPKAELLRNTIESYRRNPEDADARKSYEALKRDMKSDPHKRL